jgi:hypothetical protein
MPVALVEVSGNLFEDYNETVRSSSENKICTGPESPMSEFRCAPDSESKEWLAPGPAWRATRLLPYDVDWARGWRYSLRSVRSRLEILHDTLHVVARFGERDALDPIDGINLGIARIAMLRYQFRDSATPRIVPGERHDVGATILFE